MKKIIILFAVCSFFQLGFGQDESIFNQYHITPMLVHPSYAGFQEFHQIHFNARAAWTGFPDAPKTIGATYNGPLGNTFGLGVGVIAESAAQMTRLRGRLSYAFRFPIGSQFKMAAGFSTEFQQTSLSRESLDGNFYEVGDDVVEKAVDGIQIFDAGLSFYGVYNDRTYFGLTFANLVMARLDEIVSSDEQTGFFENYILNVGHIFEIEKLGFSLEPSLMLRQVRNAPFQMDFNLKAGFLDDQLMTGLSYRSLGTLGLLMGTKLSNFQLFYTYDLSFQQFQKFNSGSHELAVVLNINSQDPKARYR